MKHDHKKCLQEAILVAENICKKEEIALTPIRKRVFELVWSNHKAIKAYDILNKLDVNDGSLTPPTVYRALDFLVDNGLVHKIESLNAFVGCSHPAKDHGCQFLICNECGDVSEFCDDKLINSIDSNAEKKGFIVKKHVLEVYGICNDCSNTKH